MSNVIYGKEVLEAINHLKCRKARPDASRITMYLNKKYGLSADAVKIAIADCVRETVVMKVEYKGYISYRDASKYFHGKKNSFKSNLIMALLQTFEILVKKKSEISITGTTLSKFKESLLKTKVLKSHKNFKAVLDIAISNGIFTILSNKNIIATKYMKYKCTKLKDDVYNAMYIKNDDNSGNQIEDANSVEHILNVEHSNGQNFNKCVVCGETITTVAHIGNVIDCRSCLSKCHVKCAYNTSFYKYKEWKCMNCRICIKCNKAKSTVNPTSLVTCLKCNSSYHKQCHFPKIQEAMDSQSFWVCHLCEDKNDVNNILAKTSFFCSPGNISQIKYEPWEHKAIWKNFKPRLFGAFSDKNIDYLIPDATHWTCDELYNYFKDRFPQGAFALKERTINGSHLLKMSRVEVIQGLGLKLGPALKLYREIVVLQQRRNDKKLYYL